MHLQQNKTGKNYIGIVSDATEQDRIAAKAVRSWPRVVGYLADRLLAALGRHPKGALGPPRF